MLWGCRNERNILGDCDCKIGGREGVGIMTELDGTEKCCIGLNVKWVELAFHSLNSLSLSLSFYHDSH